MSIVPLGSLVQPLRGSDSIMWTIKFRNGTLKRFKFPIRTTEEGSIQPGHAGQGEGEETGRHRQAGRYFTDSGGYRKAATATPARQVIHG
ncbi:MAG: hypothetical protein U1F67_15930 [Rubrivivax sp.]